MLMFIFSLHIMPDCFALASDGLLLVLAREAKRSRGRAFFVRKVDDRAEIHECPETMANGKICANTDLSVLSVLGKNSLRASF